MADINGACWDIEIPTPPSMFKPRSLASETSALITKLSCLTFEEKVPVRRASLHFGVPTSFLQDRVIWKINADTAKSGLLEKRTMAETSCFNMSVLRSEG